jgi:hypothetical protein
MHNHIPGSALWRVCRHSENWEFLIQNGVVLLHTSSVTSSVMTKCGPTLFTGM